MQDCIEAVLKVDAFTEAVSRDQHAPLSLDDAARLILGDAPATGAAA